MSASDQNGYIKGEEFEEKLLAQELEHIRKQHKDVKKDNLFGLAFSGGGIRSAVFSLGVMQALAEKRWLKKFHYLSTVSGGGYIGSSLTWLLHDKWQAGKTEFNVDEKFPYAYQHGSHPDAISTRMLTHLQQSSNYLTPGGGITAASLAAVILRGSLLSLLVYLVPLIALMGIIASTTFTPLPALFGDLSFYTGQGYPGWNVFLVFSLLALGFFAALAVWYGLQTSRSRSPAEAYLGRRAYEKKAGEILLIAVFLAVVGSLPFAAALLGQAKEVMAASLTASGVIASVFSILKAQGDEKGKIPLGLIAPIALILLVYGVLLGGFLVAIHLVLAGSWLAWGILLAGVALAFIIGTRVNINYISIHRYYRDRLMELFMPDVEDVLECNCSDMADSANASALHEMCDFEHGKARGPYHLINANMVTEGSSIKRLRGRGGESFLLSPLYCGSEATGWRATSRYMKQKMNLATAMAISGAAADPHGAPGGEGLTRNKSLSFLMALLNVRLGYWAPNPNKEEESFKLPFPTWFSQGKNELLAMKMDETADFVHLADGGHFENLALYELIRRKVKTIVVCDGAADVGFTFVDFANLVEKIRVDFGVSIEVQGHPDFKIKSKQAKSLLAMCPKANVSHPHGVDLADSGFVTATIDYGEGASPRFGTLIYIKTTIIGGLPDDIYSYKRGHEEFPDETTADQFFDEKQFEAYRELGYRIGLTLEGNAAVRKALGLKPAKDAAPA